MTLFQVLLVIHLLAAIIWIGGALVGMLIGGQLVKAGDAPTLGRFCSAFAEIAGPLFGGSSIIVVATGIWMVADSPAVEFSTLWISIGFAGWFVSMVMGATIVGKSWSRLGLSMLEPGATIEAAAPAIARAQLLTWIDLAIRVGVVVVMVWRPT